MKRALVATVVMGLLAACAGVTAPGAAKTDTPQQSLTATGTAMARVQSVRFDANGTVTLTLPQPLVAQLRTAAGTEGSFLTSPMTVALKITGVARRPDQLDAVIEARTGSLTITSEVIAVGGRAYYKDPLSGTWKSVKANPAAGSTASRPSLSYQMILDTAKSLTEVNDQPSTLDGVSVDHYRVMPDLVKLLATVLAGQSGLDGGATGAPQAVLQNATLVADVWTGSGDHLIRRLSYDADVTADLHQFAASDAGDKRAGLGGLGLAFPAGSTAYLTAHIIIDLHDFGSNVSIEAPTVTS